MKPCAECIRKNGEPICDHPGCCPMEDIYEIASPARGIGFRVPQPHKLLET